MQVKFIWRRYSTKPEKELRNNSIHKKSLFFLPDASTSPLKFIPYRIHRNSQHRSADLLLYRLPVARLIRDQHFLIIVTNGAKLPLRQRLRENACVDEAERIPFGRGFGFEIPENLHPENNQKVSNHKACVESQQALRRRCLTQPCVLASKVSICASIYPLVSSLNCCVHVSMKLTLRQLPTALLPGYVPSYRLPT